MKRSPEHNLKNYVSTPRVTKCSCGGTSSVMRKDIVYCSKCGARMRWNRVENYWRKRGNRL